MSNVVLVLCAAWIAKTLGAKDPSDFVVLLTAFAAVVDIIRLIGWGLRESGK